MRSSESRRNILVCSVCLLTLSASVLPAQELASGTSVAVATRPRGATVGPADTISINALNCEEISKTWRVSTSGELNLPMVGRIQAAGLTVEQLEQEITTKLAKYVREPQVSLFVTEYHSQPVTVTGAVARPGTLQLEGAKTLFDVLIMAGGPKDAGSTVTIKRGTEHGSLPLTEAKVDRDNTYSFADLDLKEVMSGRGEKASIPILPYDVITVTPAQAARYIYISGEVNRPGSVELVTQDSVSLMKVLAVAGGLTPNAKPGKTRIMHTNQDGVQTSTSYIDLGKIVAGKARDLQLTVGDVVVVPSSSVKSVLHTATASAITSGVYTAVYVLGKF